MPSDLELFVRLAVPGEGALLALTGKFGVGVDEAARPGARRARPRAARSASPSMSARSASIPRPTPGRSRSAAEVVRRVGPVDDLDVGGGFPARYRGDEPAFEAFVAAIREAVARHGLDCRLQCEPGRALVADGASVLARVELRRGDSLYLNDGVYGNLAELKWIGPQFPMRAGPRAAARATAAAAGFDLFGPTCDSIDSMPGPHWLPADTDEGDWVEVGMMGAYSNALKTRFNGFGSERMAILADGGWYLGEPARRPVRACRWRPDQPSASSSAVASISGWPTGHADRDRSVELPPLGLLLRLDGSRGLAEGGDRRQELLAMTELGDAEPLQITFGRATQDVADVVAAEQLGVTGHAEPVQPDLDIRDTGRGPAVIAQPIPTRRRTRSVAALTSRSAMIAMKATHRPATRPAADVGLGERDVDLLAEVAGADQGGDHQHRDREHDGLVDARAGSAAAPAAARIRHRQLAAACSPTRCRPRAALGHLR